jgi:hypothetical protein
MKPLCCRQRQVTFSDTEGTCPKEKENSHMQRQACLEQEIKNLSSLVGKLGSSIEDNVVERRTERQMSSQFLVVSHIVIVASQ